MCKAIEMDKRNKDNGVIEGARRATEMTPGGKDKRPDSEVVGKPTRRKFSAKQKLKILKEIDECGRNGEVGALLRRYGLFSSTVSGWRRQRERGELEGLHGKKVGRPSIPKDPRDKIIHDLEKENRKLKRNLDKAEVVIDIQKKVATLLGIHLDSPPSDEND